MYEDYFIKEASPHLIHPDRTLNYPASVIETIQSDKSVSHHILHHILEAVAK